MHLQIRGMKAADRDIELARLNVLCSANGTGKSSIVDAIRFLALGYVPALGKTHAATADLMGTDHMAVQLVLDDGRAATRTLRRNGDKLEMTVHTTWSKDGFHDAAILALFGENEADVAEQLDIRELLSLSAGQRAARIERIVGSGGEADDLAGRVARVTIARLLGLDPGQLPESLKEARANLAPGRDAVIQEIGPTLSANLREQGLPPVLELITKAKNEAADAVKKRHAARDEIQTRLSTLGSASLAIEDLEAERDALQRSIGAHNQFAKAEARRTRELDAARSELATVTSTHEAALDQMVKIAHAATSMIEELEKKPEEYDGQIAVLRAQTFGVHIDNERIKLIEQTLPSLVDVPVEDLTRYEKTVEQLEKELAGAHESPWAEVRRIGEQWLAGWSDDMSAAVAPRRLVALADENGGNTVALESTLLSAKDALKLAGERAAIAMQTNVERATKRAELETEASVLRTESAGAVAKVKRLEKERDAEVEALVAKKNQVAGAIAQARQNVREQDAHVGKLQETLAAVTERVAQLEQQPVETPDAPDLGELDRITTAISAATQRASLKSELDTIVKEIERKDAEVDVYRALEWALKFIRAEDLRSKGEGIVSLIGAFLRAAGRDEIPYIESKKNVCALGWVRPDGRRVSVSTLSGGEWAMYAAALTSAVLTKRGGELRVLMVEAAEADFSTMVALVNGIAAMEKLTHVLLLSAHDVAPEVTGNAKWNHVQLEAVAA